MNKLSSAPSTYNQEEILEELNNDFERDSISQGSLDTTSSNSSDSLRRRLRSRSSTSPSIPTLGEDTLLSTRTPRKDGLASLSAGYPPPAVKSRTRTGSRSSIMRSASGASDSLVKRRASTHRHGSDSGSIGSGSLRSSPKQGRKGEKVPEPGMQPEPAPRGMVQRARSASLSSNGSSLASSRNGSRKGSFREGVNSGGLGLSMTSSNPGTPGVEGERRV